MAVSQARLNAYRSDVDAAAEAAGVFVNDYIGTLMALYPDMSVADIRDEAIEAIKDALNAFGDQAAATALELLEEIVASYGTSVTTSIVDAIDDAMIDGGVRYAARKLVTGDVAAFTADVADLSRFYIKRSAFENMVANCERNDLRYARVPSGLETCSFCFMLSTRGFVYHTAQTAGEGHPYHRNCSCVVTPGYEGISWDSQVEGYEPNEMYKRWADCAKTILLDPNTKDKSEQKAIRKEVDTRDYRWLNTGKVPEITFETDELEQEIRTERKHELDTAEILREKGIATDFIVDSREYFDEVTGTTKRIGLSDLANGYELKAVQASQTYNTTNDHLKNTSRKQNAKYVCFDNSNGVMDDETLIKNIERSQTFRRGRVYIIDSTGEYRFIR